MGCPPVSAHVAGRRGASHHAALHDPERLLRPGLILLAVVALIALPFALLHLYAALARRLLRARLRPYFYLRMTRRLARRGYRRSAAQTASEFAASIGDPSLREAVLRFNTAYERARFGDSAAAAETLPALLDQVHRALARS